MDLQWPSERYINPINFTDWISCSERLPEKGEEVLVWSDRYGRTFATFVDENKHGQIWLYHDNPIVTFNAPSHWIKLPKKPNERI